MCDDTSRWMKTIFLHRRAQMLPYPFPFVPVCVSRVVHFISSSWLPKVLSVVGSKTRATVQPCPPAPPFSPHPRSSLLRSPPSSFSSLCSCRKYSVLQPPFFMKKDVMAGVAQLEQFDEELYKVLAACPLGCSFRLVSDRSQTPSIVPPPFFCSTFYIHSCSPRDSFSNRVSVTAVV